MAKILVDGREIDVENEKSTFWQLINKYSVRIPDLQRDYAYGRDKKIDNVSVDKKNVSGDESTKIIRENFVKSTKDTLKGSRNLNLNFIYGASRDGGLYSPIDGQQRLTTLFVLHWYVFQRAGDLPALEVLKNRFSYATRDTSERFCSSICHDLSLDFTGDKISDQISDCAWFADNFAKDPTVWSMLVVMDSIHYTFKDESGADLTNFASILKDPDCAINIETLTLPALGNEEDLYIKMNGRGKQLSDFEIFKSLLQNSKELKCILGGTPSLNAISDYIGKYNTEYSKLFNSIVGKPLLVEDVIYAFIRNYMMCCYFARVSSDGVKEENYRLDCGKFRFYNGKVLFEFFSNPDYYHYYSNLGIAAPADINMESIKNAEIILSKINDYYKINGAVDADSKYYDLKERIIGLSDDERHMYDDFVDYALFQFIYKFGYPQTQNEKEAYITWKRYIFNIANNVDLKGSNESLVKLVRVIDGTINNISAYSENDVLKSIKLSNDNVLLKNVSMMKPQFDEESIKADLVLSNISWKKPLIDAEDYFTGGQIEFLLQMSLDSQGKYDLASFTTLFTAAQKVWKSDKTLNSSVDSMKLAKALLCVPDNTSNHSAQLVPLNSDTYEIPIDNYIDVLRNYTDKDKTDKCAQWEIIKTLLDKVASGKPVDDSSDTLIQSKGQLDYWKECFVDKDLFGSKIADGVDFSNCVYFMDNDLLMLSKKSVRSRNMSLKTLMLYYEMKSAGLDGKLNVYPTQEILDDQGNPHRTIGYEGKNNGYKNIGYNSDTQDYVIIEDGIFKKTIPDILIEIKNL